MSAETGLVIVLGPAAVLAGIAAIASGVRARRQRPERPRARGGPPADEDQVDDDRDRG